MKAKLDPNYSFAYREAYEYILTQNIPEFEKGYVVSAIRSEQYLNAPTMLRGKVSGATLSTVT